MIQLDLHQIYRIDLDDRALLRSRRWSWLRLRIQGLMTEPESRLCRALNPEKTEGGRSRGTHGR